MNDSQRILADLGVSSAALDRACGLSLEAGALGAKLTGAGGGGCVIALAPGRQEQVARALEPLGTWVRATSVGSG
jgi:mevalonate kinase